MGPGPAYDLDGATTKGQSGVSTHLPRTRGTGGPRDAVQRGSSLRRGASSIENNSEINYGVNNDAIERSYGRRNDNKLDIDRPDSHLNGALEYQRDILKGDSLSRGSKASVNSKSVANLGRANNYGSVKLREGGARREGALDAGGLGGTNPEASGKKGGGAGSLIQLHRMKAPSGPGDEDDVDGLSKVLDDIGYSQAAANTDPSYEAGAEDNIYDTMVNQTIDPQANSLLLRSETVATFVFNSLKLGMGIDNGQVAQLLQ